MSYTAVDYIKSYKTWLFDSIEQIPRHLLEYIGFFPPIPVIVGDLAKGKLKYHKDQRIEFIFMISPGIEQIIYSFPHSSSVHITIPSHVKPSPGDIYRVFGRLSEIIPPTSLSDSVKTPLLRRKEGQLITLEKATFELIGKCGRNSCKDPAAVAFPIFEAHYNAAISATNQPSSKTIDFSKKLKEELGTITQSLPDFTTFAKSM